MIAELDLAKLSLSLNTLLEDLVISALGLADQIVDLCALIRSEIMELKREKLLTR